MRNPDRLEPYYEQLALLHKTKIPDWRIGQFMCNLIGWYYQETGRDLFYLEDAQFMDIVREFFEEDGMKDLD